MPTNSATKRRLLPSPVEFLVVAIIISLMMLFLWPAVQATRNPRGPHGRMIPTEPPDESHRIRNADGLSIVLPKNWEVWEAIDSTFPEAKYLRVYPRGAPGRRLKALLIVQPGRTPGSGDVSAFTKTTFLGSDAYERMLVERKDTFDDPAWSQYAMYFQHGGEWWYVRYGLA